MKCLHFTNISLLFILYFSLFPRPFTNETHHFGEINLIYHEQGPTVQLLFLAGKKLEIGKLVFNISHAKFENANIIFIFWVTVGP